MPSSQSAIGPLAAPTPSVTYSASVLSDLINDSTASVGEVLKYGSYAPTKDANSVLNVTGEDGRRAKAPEYQIQHNDYTAFKAMDLMDEDSLDSIYAMHKLFPDAKYKYTFLSTLYRNKYSDLYEKYPGLPTFMAFTLYVAVHYDFNTLAAMKSTRLGPVLKRGADNYSLLNPFIKRRKQTQSGSAVQNTAGAAVDTASKKHPFLETKDYLQSSKLYKFGSAVSTLFVPPDFAICEGVLMPTKIRPFTKEGSGGVKKEFEGLTLKMNLPILSNVLSEKRKFYNYNITTENINSLRWLLRNMTDNLSLSNIAIGIRKEAKVRSYTKVKEVSYTQNLLSAVDFDNRRSDELLFCTFETLDLPVDSSGMVLWPRIYPELFYTLTTTPELSAEELRLVTNNYDTVFEELRSKLCDYKREAELDIPDWCMIDDVLE